MKSLIKKIKFNLKDYFLEHDYFIDEFTFLVQLYLDNGFIVEISYTVLNSIGKSKELFHSYYITNGYLIFKKRTTPNSILFEDLSTGRKDYSINIKTFYDLYELLNPPVNTVYGILLFLSHANEQSIASLLIGSVGEDFRAYCIVASIKTGYSLKTLATLFHKNALQIKCLKVNYKDINQYLMMVTKRSNELKK